jgi:hypothetical protein
LALINIIALVKSPFILDTAIERQVIATADHLMEALKITQEIINGNLVGIPKDKIDFLKEIFLAVFNTQKEPKRDDKTGKIEKYRAVTTGELSDYYQKVKLASISTTSIQKTYLAELIAGNLISEEKSAIHSNYNIYRPTFDLDDPNSNSVTTLGLINQQQKRQLDSFYSNLGKFESDLQVPPLKLSKFYKEIPENWLILEILRIASIRIWQDTSKYNLADLINRSEEFKLLEVSSTIEIRLTAKEFILTFTSSPVYKPVLQFSYQTLSCIYNFFNYQYGII